MQPPIDRTVDPVRLQHVLRGPTAATPVGLNKGTPLAQVLSYLQDGTLVFHDERHRTSSPLLWQYATALDGFGANHFKSELRARAGALAFSLEDDGTQILHRRSVIERGTVELVLIPFLRAGAELMQAAADEIAAVSAAHRTNAEIVDKVRLHRGIIDDKCTSLRRSPDYAWKPFDEPSLLLVAEAALGHAIGMLNDPMYDKRMRYAAVIAHNLQSYAADKAATYASEPYYGAGYEKWMRVSVTAWRGVLTTFDMALAAGPVGALSPAKLVAVDEGRQGGDRTAIVRAELGADGVVGITDAKVER